MEGRIGKLTVDVWIGLPQGDEIRARVSDTDAGHMAVDEIMDAVRFGTLVNGGSLIVAVEMVTPATEATPDVVAAFEERVRVQAEAIAHAHAEEATV